MCGVFGCWVFVILFVVVDFRFWFDLFWLCSRISCGHASLVVAGFGFGFLLGGFLFGGLGLFAF